MTQRSLPQDGVAPEQVDAGVYPALIALKELEHRPMLGHYNPSIKGNGLRLKNYVESGNVNIFTISAGVARVGGKAYELIEDAVFNISKYSWSGAPANSIEVTYECVLVSNTTASAISYVDEDSGMGTQFFPYLGTNGVAQPVPANTVSMRYIVLGDEDPGSGPTILSLSNNYLPDGSNGIYVMPIHTTYFTMGREVDPGVQSKRRDFVPTRGVLAEEIAKTSWSTFIRVTTSIRAVDKVHIKGILAALNNAGDPSSVLSLVIKFSLLGANAGVSVMLDGDATPSSISGNDITIDLVGLSVDNGWSHVLLDITLTKMLEYYLISGNVYSFWLPEGNTGILPPGDLPQDAEASIMRRISGNIFLDDLPTLVTECRATLSAGYFAPCSSISVGVS